MVKSQVEVAKEEEQEKRKDDQRRKHQHYKKLKQKKQILQVCHFYLFYQTSFANKLKKTKNKKHFCSRVYNFIVKHTDHNFSVALQKARIAKGWKQEDLAHRLNVHKTIVNQYESGKAIPNPQIIATMNRILGVKLPRPGGKK